VQKAVIKDHKFVLIPSGICAVGEILQHPKRGINFTGGIQRTSRVVKRFKNGNFKTVNTHYTVQK